jgi:hypothetical protein
MATPGPRPPWIQATIVAGVIVLIVGVFWCVPQITPGGCRAVDHTCRRCQFALELLTWTQRRGEALTD